MRLLDDIETERGGRMADEVLSVLRIFFDWHARRDDTFSIPLVRGMGLTKPQDRIRNRILTDDEVVRVWRAADAMARLRPLRAVSVADCRTPQRGGPDDHAELTAGDWLIPASRYKTKNDHLVPLSGAALAVLEKVPRFADCDYVFTTDGTHAHRWLLRPEGEVRRGVGRDRLHAA